jgi:hypothetical protein
LHEKLLSAKIKKEAREKQQETRRENKPQDKARRLRAGRRWESARRITFTCHQMDRSRREKNKIKPN